MSARPAQVKKLLEAAHEAAEAHHELHEHSKTRAPKQRLNREVTRRYNAAYNRLWRACYEVAGLEPPTFVSNK